MPTAQEIYDELSQPFPIEYIEWRVGSTNPEKTRGLPLCYIDARAVMDRLDTVCGPENWQNTYSAGMANSLVCNIGIRIGTDWIWKADGAGSTDFEAEKGALSDAFKRSAVRWGIGRYLYSLKAPWVPIEARGKSYSIPEAEEKKLNNLHDEFALKCGWGLRSGVQAYKLLDHGIRQLVRDPATAVEFRENSAGMIAQLPVAMRRHLNQTLDRIGAPASEAQ